MELCLECEVFRENFSPADWEETLQVIKEQFLDYRKELEEKLSQLERMNKKLEEFRITSVYLLGELHRKREELWKEREKLQKKVEEKIKEIRTMERELLQSAKMAALGRFAAGIAHEVNNPLAGILNCVRTLLGDPEIKGRRRGYLELALKGLQRIENTLKQILSFSGKREFNPQRVDINRLLQESISFTIHRIREEGITLEEKFFPGLIWVWGDPHQLQQVFLNIIANALDAMEPGGRLSISTSLNGQTVEVRFQDTGKGIREEDLERIFDPFFTTKETGKGVGLGLSISYTIIKQHQGDIEIESELNKGTTVTVTLPIKS